MRPASQFNISAHPPQSKVLAGEESTRQSLVKGGAEYLAKVRNGDEAG